ncbi:MAG TPA: tetratricopeptide repeat protein, partial [Deltaproteobacteria bacterium]|nr:tetratricopeptide repeat protein [Deltaproteobacteria bacterium]
MRRFRCENLGTCKIEDPDRTGPHQPPENARHRLRHSGSFRSATPHPCRRTGIRLGMILLPSHLMQSFRRRLLGFSVGLLLVQASLGFGLAHAQCFLTDDLPLKEQFEMLKEMHKDGIHDTFLEASRCLLKQVPQHPFRSELLFKQAESHRQLGRIRPALNDYTTFLGSNPKNPKFREQALLHQGELSLKLNEFASAKQALRQLLKDYPDTSSVNRVHYGLGRAEFLLGLRIQQQKGKVAGQKWFAEAAQELETTSRFQLNDKELQERHWMLGWAWWFQDRPERAEAPWRQYRQAFKAEGKVSADRRPDELAYRLAVGFQRNKALGKAEEYHALVVE